MIYLSFKIRLLSNIGKQQLLLLLQIDQTLLYPNIALREYAKDSDL